MTTRHVEAEPSDTTARDFGARLERYYRDNYRALVRRHLRLGAEDQVQDAIQKVFMRIYERHIDGELDDIQNFDAYVNTGIRHSLLDQLQAPKAVSVDEDEDAGGWDSIAASNITPEDEKAWRQLIAHIFARLPEKYADVAAMVMKGDTPDEISKAYGGQDGYVLRRYTRDLICGILKRLTDGGDSFAAAFRRDFCKPDGPKRPKKTTIVPD